MTKKVVGIRFKKAGKIYYFDPLDLELNQYDHAVVETIQGVEYGEVALPPRQIDDAIFNNPVKPVLRKATAQDDRDYQMLKEKEEKARGIFEDKVKAHKLEMKLINVEYTFDKKKAIFYFTADGRVDFRNLVKDLASIFRVRIELRQIGVRDEAKIFNTLGVCGRNTCCSQWLGDFTPVSIKMAKEQNLSLNSTKISGICGRLLCCLTYEHDFYHNVTKKMPKVGQMVETPDGVGQVFRLGVLQENVQVRMQVGNEETEIRTYSMDDVKRSDAPRPQRNRNGKRRDDKPEEGNKPSGKDNHRQDNRSGDKGDKKRNANDKNYRKRNGSKNTGNPSATPSGEADGKKEGGQGTGRKNNNQNNKSRRRKRNPNNQNNSNPNRGRNTGNGKNNASNNKEQTKGKRD